MHSPEGAGFQPVMGVFTSQMCMTFKPSLMKWCLSILEIS